MSSSKCTVLYNTAYSQCTARTTIFIIIALWVHPTAVRYSLGSFRSLPRCSVLALSVPRPSARSCLARRRINCPAPYPLPPPRSRRHQHRLATAAASSPARVTSKMCISQLALMSPDCIRVLTWGQLVQTCFAVFDALAIAVIVALVVAVIFNSGGVRLFIMSSTSK